MSHLDKQLRENNQIYLRVLELMDSEISIKLKDGAVPHVEPIRCAELCRNH